MCIGNAASDQEVAFPPIPYLNCGVLDDELSDFILPHPRLCRTHHVHRSMETPVCIYADPSGKNGSLDKTSPMRAPGREGGHVREKLEILTSAEPSGSPPKTEAKCSIPLRRFTPSGRVTSVDLTPDGAYVIAGCSDGTLRLYSMLHPSWGSEGLLLGQIHAKGLITNLIFHVEVADDGRFAFAGVLRGSVEMFAYDLTRLPRGHFGEGLDAGGEENEDVNLSKAAAELLIECHTNLDAKLRGFGAVTRVAPTRAASGLGAWEMESEAEPPEYRLICGLGIKNLHIWRFQQGSQVECSAPTWECIFDLASNGMSIELLTVRAGGLEAVSKSCGQNLRVWDLSSLEKKDRAPYTDILNTQDIRAVCGDYAFGGTCQLSLVRLDACCELNRMELPLPTTVSSKALSGGKAKRRQLCSVKDVVGTQGEGTQGGRVLVVCSDGGVHCYENTGATSATGKLVPVHSLTTEVDEDVSFSLALVGSPEMATPVVMQTRWLADENCGEITVEPLRLDQAKEEAVAVRRRALGQLEPNKVGRQGCREGDGGVAKGKGPSKGHSRGSIGNCPLMSPVDALAPKLQSGASTVTPCRGNNPRGALPQGPAPASVKKSATKKRAKSLPSHGGHASEKPSIEDFKVGVAVKDASERSASVASSGLVAIKSSVPMRRSALVAPPLAHSRAAAASVRAPPLAGVQPHHPLKRRPYDPFAAVTRPKRGKNAYEGPSKAMRDLEAKRAAEEAGSKTQDFFLERVAREDILREMRIASVLEARRERILATTSGGWDEQTPSFVEAGPFSTVTTWGGLREKHRRDTENLRLNFKAEHDR